MARLTDEKQMKEQLSEGDDLFQWIKHQATKGAFSAQVMYLALKHFVSIEWYRFFDIMIICCIWVNGAHTSALLMHSKTSCVKI